MPANPPSNQEGRTLVSALKCLELLDAFADSSSPLGVSECARRVGSSRGTVHQRLRTLIAAGWLERLAGGRYRLTLHASRVAQAALEQAGLGERVLPALKELAERTGAAASLAVLEGNSGMISQRVESASMLRANVQVGMRMPLASSASGRVLVAFSNESTLRRLRSQPGLRLPSMADIADTRQQGCAVSVGEYIEGISAIAVPIFNSQNELLAALSLAGPTSTFDVKSAQHETVSVARQIHSIIRGRSN